MPKALITNNGSAAITLPLPYVGVLPAGGATVVDDEAKYVVQQFKYSPTIASVLSVKDVPPNQPVDGHTREKTAIKLTDAFAVTTVPLGLNGQRIINVADPIDPQDVATKQYVDTHGGGGGGGSGTVTSITAGTGLTGGTITVSGTIAVDFGTAAGKVTQGNDARLNPAPSVAGAVVYDNGTVYTKTAAGTIGQVLKVGSLGLPEWGDDTTIPTGSAGGSLAGTYPNPSIASGAITNTEVATGAGILTSKLSGLLTDISGNGLTAFLAAGSLVARTYYVATNGNDTTGNGSPTSPFATIQKAHDVAEVAYPGSEMVMIDVGPGTFAGALNLTRYNTLIQGQGHRAEMFATVIQGTITVNPSTATQKFNHLVGIAGAMIAPSSGTTTAAVRVTGSGLYSVIFNDCYITTINAATTANAIWCDATHAQRPRIVVNDSILTIQTAGPNILQFDQGDVRIDNTQILQGSSVASGSAGTGIVVANTATLWLNASLVQTQTTGPGIDASGTSAGSKLILTNSGVTTTYSGGADTSHGITVTNSTGFAAFIYQTTFSVSDVSSGVYAINGITPAAVVFGDVSFQPGTNSAIASTVTLTPMVEKHGTINLPNLTASLPLQLDANKNVVAQAVSMSALSGTLPIDKGGTGISTIGGNGTVAYSNGTTIAYTDVGLAGYPLLSTGVGKPAFAALDLGTLAVTGALPANKQAAQTMSGDVTGTTDASTVVALQGYSVVSTAPSAGQALVWSGSDWTPSTISPGGGGGGGGGGLTYYLNYGIDGALPLPAVGGKQMSLVYDTVTGQTNTGAVVAPQGSYATLAEFVTDLNLPGATTVPPGTWDFAVYLNLATGTDSTFFRVRLFKWNGTTLTELSTSPSDDVAVSSSVLPEIYTASLYVEQAVLSAFDRLVVRLEVTRNVLGVREVTGYFGGNTPSHVHSTIGAPGGTGLVKVVDGIIQSPATQLVNADVSSNAAIAVSKLELGPVNTVLRGGAVSNSFGKVQLSTDVEGQLPIANGGTGLASGNAGGVVYFATNSTLASSATLSQHAIVIGGGSSNPPATLGSLGTGTQVLHGNASGAPTWGAVNLASDVTGTLPVANGGTGATAIGAAGAVVYSTGTAFAFSAAGNAGELLTSNGIGAPTWSASVAISQGGTGGTASPTSGAVAYGTGAAYDFTTVGTAGQVLVSDGANAPQFSSTLGAASSDLTVAGRDVGSATAVNVTGNSYTFTVSTPVIRITTTPTGGAVLGSTPTIATSSITNGTRLTIINETPDAVTFQDENTVLGTKVQLGGVTQRTLTQWQSIDFVYSNGFWIERAVGGSGVVQSVASSAPTAVNGLIVVGGTTGLPTVGIRGLAGDNPGVANSIPYFSDAKTLATLSVGTSGQYLKSNGAGAAPSWVAIPYDVAGMIAGKPEATATIFYFKATRAFTLSATSGDHVFTAATAATGASVFTVKKNALTMFTATFAASGAVATIGSVSNNTIAVGDIISVVAPNSQDSTLSDIYWTLSGTLP